MFWLLRKRTTEVSYLASNRCFITSDVAPMEDSYAGAALLLSNRIVNCTMPSGSCGPRIVFARCNLFAVCVYVPRSGRHSPIASDTLSEVEYIIARAPQHDCVDLLGDYNARLHRNTERRTGRWCIHNQANPAGTRLLALTERRQLCAVFTFHQPRRGSNNAMYISKDPRYGPSRIDYILTSCRWSSSAHKCSVKWGVTCQRLGRHYDYGLALRAIRVSCRQDYRDYVDGVLNSMQVAERGGNSRQVSRLTRVLSGKRESRFVNQSEDLLGNMLVTQGQLLEEW